MTPVAPLLLPTYRTLAWVVARRNPHRALMRGFVSSYSPEKVEGYFSELRDDGFLGSSLQKK